MGENREFSTRRAGIPSTVGLRPRLGMLGTWATGLAAIRPDSFKRTRCPIAIGFTQIEAESIRQTARAFTCVRRTGCFVTTINASVSRTRDRRFFNARPVRQTTRTGDRAGKEQLELSRIR